VTFLRRLLGGGAEGRTSTEGVDEGGALPEASDGTFELHGDRHRVSVWLRLADPAFENEREQVRLFGLEDRIMRALDEDGTGEHDTNALERGYLAIRLVGDDADAIVATVRPLLADAPPGSYLAVRRGPAGSAEDRVGLGGDP
jgi:hypothetical protein